VAPECFELVILILLHSRCVQFFRCQLKVPLLGEIFPADSAYVGRGCGRHDDRGDRGDDCDDMYQYGGYGERRSRSREKKSATDENKVPALKKAPSLKRMAARATKNDVAGCDVLAIYQEEESDDDEEPPKKTKLHDLKPMNEN
jgi:hypothetical protein